MKKTILTLTLLCVFSCMVKAQGNSFANRVIGTIQENGTVEWKVSERQINDYLTSTLLSAHGVNGTITSSTIRFITEGGISFWVVQGTGLEGNDRDKSRNIRVQLEIVGNGNLKVNGGGDTESCVGDPCLDCDFDPQGGCKPCARTSSSQTGVDGICNHTKTKTTTSPK